MMNKCEIRFLFTQPVVIRCSEIDSEGKGKPQGLCVLSAREARLRFVFIRVKSNRFRVIW